MILTVIYVIQKRRAMLNGHVRELNMWNANLTFHMKCFEFKYSSFIKASDVKLYKFHSNSIVLSMHVANGVIILRSSDEKSRIRVILCNKWDKVYFFFFCQDEFTYLPNPRHPLLY